MKTMLKTTKDVEQEIGKVKLALTKTLQTEKLPDFKIEVKMAADVSGSFADEYANKLVDPFFDAAVSIAQVVDPDKLVQIVAFSSEAFDTGDYGVDDAKDVKTEFLRRVPASMLWRGTNYGRALEAFNVDAPKSTGLFSGLFGAKKTVVNSPTILLFLTDGEDGGNEATFLRNLSLMVASNYFIVLIGANNDSRQDFATLVKADEQIEGVSFHKLSDLKSLSTDKLYQQIFNQEFTKWFTKN